MTVPALLEALKNFIGTATADMKYPTAVQKGDSTNSTKVPEIFKMRLPDSTSAKKIAPYVIVQYVNGVNKQSHGEQSDSYAVIRLICVTYCADETQGAMMLINLMDRIKINLLKKVVIGDCFELDTDAGLEDLVYSDNTAPYYAGEIIGTFKMPTIDREVSYE